LGLGLSIVERISKLLGHAVQVVSTPGRGSMFSVVLPKAEPEQTAAPIAVQPVPVGRLAGIRVLCIDNEPTVLLGMQTLISGWGCAVRTAETREQAVDLCKAPEWTPDIVLADYHLDKGVGLEAIAAVRERLGRPVPAVIISADNTPEMQREVRAHGHAFLRKPVKAAALRALMSQLTVARAAAE
jgi:CheY-like chemotaxis protein